jgi:hypothetical protein
MFNSFINRKTTVAQDGIFGIELIVLNSGITSPFFLITNPEVFSSQKHLCKVI